MSGYMTRQESDAKGVTTTKPTHVRVIRESYGWVIRGYDDHGIPTWVGWEFDTFHEAVTNIEAFVEDATCYGLTWAWRTNNTQEVTA